MEVSIYICYTPFHIFISKYVAAEQSGARNILVDANGHYHPKDSDTKLFFDVLNKQVANDFFRTNRFSTQFAKAENARRLFQSLQPVLAEADKIRVFFSHLEDYLPNYLFFKFRRNKRWEFNLINDGVLNYYDVRVRGRRLLTQRMKVLVAATKGLRFTPYFGHITGIESKEIRSQYLLGLRDHAFLPSKTRIVKRRSIPKGSRGNDILVLGQETFANSIGKEEYLNYFRKVISHAVSLKSIENRIYYKSHHVNPIKAEVTKLLSDNGIIELEVKEAAEEFLIDHVEIGHLVSISSSALLNAKFLIGDDIDCTVVSFHERSARAGNPPSRQKIEALFKDVGFNIL